MAQARRRKPRKTPQSKGPGWVRRYLHPCWLMLVTGLICGSLSTWLYLGWRGADVGMGQGLKTLLHVTPASRSVVTNQAINKNTPALPKYDFYTRLLKDTPRQEQQLPEPVVKKRPSKAKTLQKAIAKASPKTTPRPNKPTTFGPGIYYMLQAGSYPGFREADRLRANLALTGLESHIEKVSIRGKGYYRVRLGPYYDDLDMRKVRKQLRNMGLAADQIRLRRPATRNTN